MPDFIVQETLVIIDTSLLVLTRVCSQLELLDLQSGTKFLKKLGNLLR